MQKDNQTSNDRFLAFVLHVLTYVCDYSCRHHCLSEASLAVPTGGLNASDKKCEDQDRFHFEVSSKSKRGKVYDSVCRVEFILID